MGVVPLLKEKVGHEVGHHPKARKSAGHGPKTHTTHPTFPYIVCPTFLGH